MKYFIIFIAHLTVALSLLQTQEALAAQWYVKPSAEVPLRRGQGTEYRIVAIIGNGTMVTVLEDDANWSKVRIQNGKEGWLLKRYLSTEKPLSDQVAELTKNKAELQEQLTTDKNRLNALLLQHKTTEQELNNCITQRDTIQSNYQTLQQETADVVHTKKKLIATEQQLVTIKEQLRDIQLENTDLKKSSALIWFVIGAGVLLLGWSIGLLSGKRSNRRRSSLL